MNVATWLAITAITIGVILVLRATAIVATKTTGRFTGDPIITTTLGFGLILVGQYLLR
ncbi:MAG TPA: hypothetical protein VFJ28_15425 [Marmoricola sp.]|nr:hypothetical protein [Marmoricola sp.]